MHVHYNWDQAEIIDPVEVIRRLKQRNIQLVVVAGTPSHYALMLQQAAGAGEPRVVPLFSPYLHPGGKSDWFLKPEVLIQARAGLTQGWYQGIGEVHFMAGLPPRPEHPAFLALTDLAREFQVPMLIHVDAAKVDYYLAICEPHAQIRMILAHAGGIYKPQQILKILQTCPNTFVDLSARDPWRYGRLTDEQNQLLPGWRELILTHPDRFMIGSDPVWRVTRGQSWDQADDGWDHLNQLWDFHLTWTAQLPADVAKKLRHDNAAKFFKQPGSEHSFR